MSGIKEFEHLEIRLQDIKSATKNFADGNCIGKGGFGKVYKGELVHYKGQSTVAIKRLDHEFGQGEPEFWNEIMMLSRYEHENIVSLLGFCNEKNERILVYEYVSRRSLDLYLKNDDLTWARRLKICIGAALGLAYLHNPDGTQHRVLHRDIKSYNILLNENWDAKISYFGLSKFGPANLPNTYVFSNPVGTIGYTDPIYAETGMLTKESDVYSFGVVLFEVLCGRLCTPDNRLTGLAIHSYEENKINEIICDKIKDEINPKSLKAFTQIAYQCLKGERIERPLMTDVVIALEAALEHQEVGRALPKFGDWDVNDPASATEYTLIFNKARDKKKKGRTTDSPPKSDSTHHKPEAATTLGKPQRVSHDAFSFNKAKDEKKTGRTTESPPKSDSTHHKPEAATTLGKPQRRTWCCFKA